jgi:hypothetical protein
MGQIRRAKHGPEWHIQEELREFLEARGWLVERMIGNAFQVGIPDLYCRHPKWGERWIDVKNAKSYSFTKAQRHKWPIWEKFNCGIWILTGATEAEYAKLFQKPNWREFWKPSYDKMANEFDVRRMVDDLAEEAAALDVRNHKLRNGTRHSRKGTLRAYWTRRWRDRKRESQAWIPSTGTHRSRA